MTTAVDNNGIKKLHAFERKEILISSAIINGVLNGIIYYFTTKGSMTIQSFALNILMTMVILSIILMPIYPALARHKLKKLIGIEVPFTKETHLLASLYPNNRIAQGIITVAICTLISTPITIGIAGFLGMVNVTVLSGAIIKGFGCGICSALAYYLTVIFVFFNMHDQAEKCKN